MPQPLSPLLPTYLWNFSTYNNFYGKNDIIKAELNWSNISSNMLDEMLDECG